MLIFICSENLLKSCRLAVFIKPFTCFCFGLQRVLDPITLSSSIREISESMVGTYLVQKMSITKLLGFQNCGRYQTLIRAMRYAILFFFRLLQHTSLSCMMSKKQTEFFKWLKCQEGNRFFSNYKAAFPKILSITKITKNYLRQLRVTLLVMLIILLILLYCFVVLFEPFQDYFVFLIAYYLTRHKCNNMRQESWLHLLM